MTDSYDRYREAVLQVVEGTPVLRGIVDLRRAFWSPTDQLS